MDSPKSTMDRLLELQRERYRTLGVSTPRASTVGCCIDGCEWCSDQFLAEIGGGDSE